MEKHAHHDHHHHGHEGIQAAFFLNLSFALIEVVGGVLTNSVAILSDALHDLGDSVALGFSWVMERISHRKPSDRLTFGYRRYSVLGALFSSIVLITGSVFILLEAIPRLINPEPVIAEGMLPMAVLGIGVNLIAVFRLRGDGDKLNQRVIMLHLLEDVLGWIGVLVVSIVLLFVDLPILDPILSVVITVYVLSRIFPRLAEALRVFLQYSPGGIELQTIRDQIREDPEISNIHDTHLWSVDGHNHVFSAHLVLTRNLTLVDTEQVKTRVKSRLAQLGIDHATLELEPAESLCKGCKD